MKKERSISIAMATYNGEKYLREQIDSILNQTVPPNEIVICDDCSSDNTWAILEEYATKDNRFKIYKNNPNLGFVKNFEKALSLTTGDYIALSDQDDVWLPDHLETLLNIIGNKALATGNALMTDSNGVLTGMSIMKLHSCDYIMDDDIEKAYSIYYYVCIYPGMGMLLSRKLLNNVLPFPEGIDYHDSWIASIACFDGGINFTEKPITLYRRLEQSITGKRRRFPRWRYVVSHFIKGTSLKYQEIDARAIEERIGYKFNNKEKEFFKDFYKYRTRIKTPWGRLLNVFFEIKNFKLIYSKK